MSTKARPTNDGSRVSFSIRLPPTSGSWLFDLAQRLDRSLTDLVVGFIEDARSWWGCSPEVGAALQTDAEKLGLTQRDYIYYLLEERYELVRKHGPGSDANKTTVRLAQYRRAP